MTEAKNTEQKTAKHRKYSLIKEKFSMDVLIELTKITMMACDNNTKCIYIRELLHENNIEFDGLGPGTNRYGINIQSTIGMVAVKIALDSDGMIDNRREFLYGKELYPDVCKVYECLPNGLIAVFEYVVPFSLDDLKRFEDDIRDILENISHIYMIGDVGIDTKNYKNWGIRMVDGREQICMLDFAYIYKISYKLFTCNCDKRTLVNYDKDYVGLVCPKCHKKYKFAHIRRKVTRKAQEEEIGDIRRLGYVLHSAEELLPDVEEFLPKSVQKEKSKAKKKSELQRIKELEEYQKTEYERDPYTIAYQKMLKEQKGELEDEQEEETWDE